MERVPGLQHGYFNARQVLRERLQRLPRLQLPDRAFREAGQTFPLDVDVLKLLSDMTYVRNNDPSIAIEDYSRRHSASTSPLPSYHEALARGWFRPIWNSVTAATPLREYIRANTLPFEQTLNEFRYWLYKGTYHVANPGGYGTASKFENFLLDQKGSDHRPPVLSSRWIAARLWDSSPVRNLANWEGKWSLLERPRVVPILEWSIEHAQEFRSAVLDAIQHSNLPGWDSDDVANAIRMSGDMRNITSDTEHPPHLLGLYCHITVPHWHGGPVYDAESLTTLMGLLVLELPHIKTGPAPSKTAQALVDLALRYPNVLETLTPYLTQVPEAIADFVLCPRATVLMCYLVATWDRHVLQARDQGDATGKTVQTALFEDCLAILRHFLIQERITADEYAYLLIVLQQEDTRQDGLQSKLPLMIEHLQDLPIAVRLQVRSSLIRSGTADANSAAFPVMLKAMAVVGTNLSEADALQVSLAYKAILGAPDYRADVSLIDNAAAGALVHLALAHHASAQDDILRPLNIPAELVANREGASFSLGSALRAHIRVLSRAIGGYPETIPDALIAALAQAIHSGARDRPNRQQVDAFSFEFSPGRRLLQRPLEIDLVDAINRLESPAQQTQLVNALLDVEEPLILATLLQRLPRIHHEAIRTRLEQLTPEQASTAYFVPQLEHRITAFLDLGLHHLAESYMCDQQLRLQGRNSADLTIASLRNKLWLHYLRDELSAIFCAEVPTELPREHELEARRTINFFRALALLKQTPPDSTQAAAIFLQLYNQQPSTVHAINLLAARMSKLLGDNTFRTLDGDAATQAKEALRHADASIPDRSTLSPEARAVHNPNCAALLLATGQPHKALRRLDELEPTGRTAESMAFEAIANARSGDHERATSIIRSATDRFGSLAIVTGAENHLAHSMPHASSVRVLLHEQSTTSIRAALKLFSELSPQEKAAVLVEGALPLEKVITEMFRNALASFQQMLSFLKTHVETLTEDDFNGLLAEMIRARVETIFSWQPHEQSPGGFTAAGNAGRRDVVIRSQGVDIAVFEALKSSTPNDPRLLDHFHKLFSYSTANILLHVTYSYRQQTPEMVAAVKQIATRPPASVSYLGQREISAEGARSQGLRGAYRRDGADVTVSDPSSTGLSSQPDCVIVRPVHFYGAAA